MAKEQISARVDSKTIKAVEKIAKKEGVSFSWLVNKILSKYIQENK